MSTTYPGTIDTYTTKVDNVTDVLASHVNNLQDAMVAVETALGTEGQTGLSEGRLTLATGTPVTTTDQTAKTTIYFTPYKGNRISIYNGSTGWITYAFTEKSVSVPATTVTPFDVFAYITGGAVTLSTTNWTNDTTRATALTTQDGIYVKSGATGYRYLGTGRTTAVSGQTEDSILNRFLWNFYNQVPRRLYRTYSSSHTYNTATWRPFNNALTSVAIYWVVGLAEDAVFGSASGNITWAAGNSGLYVAGAVNSTSVPGMVAAFWSGVAGTVLLSSIGGGIVTLGLNYMTPLEYSNAAGTAPTFIDCSTTAIVRA